MNNLAKLIETIRLITFLRAAYQAGVHDGDMFGNTEITNDVGFRDFVRYQRSAYELDQQLQIT